jgi:hypothetical protein
VRISEHAYLRAEERLKLSRDAFTQWVDSTNLNWRREDYESFRLLGYNIFEDLNAQYFYCPWTPDESLALITCPEAKLLKSVNTFKFTICNQADLDRSIDDMVEAKNRACLYRSKLEEERSLRLSAEAKLKAKSRMLDKEHESSQYWYQRYIDSTRTQAHESWARGGWSESSMVESD